MTEPLIRISSWNTGINANAVGQNLAAQLDRIDAGEYILPVIQLPMNGLGNSADSDSMQRLASMGLPFSVRVNNAAEIPASRIGDALSLLAQYYPDPPYVIVADNNEGAVADAMTPEQSKALHDAVRQFVPTWDLVWVGYGVEPVTYELGRIGKGIDTSCEIGWDGGSPSALYINRTDYIDTAVCCQQLWAVNVAYGERFMPPNWWQELSIWHGDGKIERIGLTPERYEGYAMFGVLAVRPEVLREFLGSKTPFAQYEPFTRALYRVAKRINDDPIVRRFWDDGRVVISPQPSPLYRNLDGMPDLEYRDILLPCDANPEPRRNDDGTYARSIWGLDDDLVIPVKAQAWSIGDHEFLVFAQAPMGAQNVTVSVLGLGDQHFDSIPPEGIFQYVDARPDLPTEPPIINPWVNYEMEINGEIVPIKLREVGQ